MNLKRFRIIAIIAFISYCSQTTAQQNYRAEIGITAGSAYYLGDANTKLFKNMELSYGGFLRYRINPRIALRAELNSTKISGEYTDTKNKTTPFVNELVYSVDACGEFNFFDLEESTNKRLSKIYTPYIFGGIGMMTDVYTGQKLPKLSIPFGIGFKVILAKRWNANIQWSNKILFSDQLEDVAELNDSQNLNGSNFLNKDLLSTLTIGISFDFWKKQCDCRNTNNKNKR